MTTAKILLYDLETSPNLQYAYGTYKPYTLRVKEYGSIMSISWCWYGETDENGEPVVHHENLTTIPYKQGSSANKALVKHLHSLLDAADIVIAHNAYGFDNKVAAALMARHGLTPPSPFKTVDTLRAARQNFRFPGGNRLNDLGLYFGFGEKSQMKVGDLWFDCLKGDKKAWKLLQEYNDQDVVLLYRVYEKLRPWIRNHPNLGDLSERDGVCPKCESRHLQKRGYNHRRNGKVQRYQCMDCGGWTNEAKLNTKGRLVNAV